MILLLLCYLSIKTSSGSHYYGVGPTIWGHSNPSAHQTPQTSSISSHHQKPSFSSSTDITCGIHNSSRKLFSKSFILMAHYIRCLHFQARNRMCVEMSCRIRENGTWCGMPSFFQLWGNRTKCFLENVTEYKRYSLTDLFTHKWTMKKQET